MSRKMQLLGLACCLVFMAPALATNPLLQTSMLGWSGATVTLSVHNPSTTQQSGSVSVTVAVGGGEVVTLTSANLTLGPGTTTQVVLSAPRPLTIIDDDPEPF